MLEFKWILDMETQWNQNKMEEINLKFKNIMKNNNWK